MVGLFRRHASNPVLTIEEMPAGCASVFNPAATLTDEGVVLLARVEDRRGISSLWVARSPDGIGGWKVDPQPLLAPEHSWEEWGCEDPRITWMPELGEWLIAYTGYSHVGPGVALARTSDFREVTKIGLVLSPENKDAALFPCRFDGEWLLLHRPVSGQTGHIWLASSPDLVHWGKPRVLLESRAPVRWDGTKVGAGAQPVELPDGWLLVYHGVKLMVSGPVYRVGLALLHRERPWEVLARTEDWVLGPETAYERTGDVPNVVFPCGAFVRGDELWVYYGAGDSSVGLATAPLAELLAALRAGRGDPEPGFGSTPPVTRFPS